jgi:pimeloyl-ACP methyl ester carboxylesterase
MSVPMTVGDDAEHPFRAQPREGDLLGAGVRLHYLEWGRPDAPPLLFLHGAALTAHTWDVVCDLLGTDHRCLAVDLRGHGDSEWPHDVAYGLDAYAADVDKIVQWFGLEHFVLIGMSLGGLTALTYAGRPGARLRGLVLVDSGPTMGRRSPGAARLHTFVDGPEEFASVDECVERAIAFNPLRSRERLRRTLLFNLRQTPRGTWTWKYDRRARARPPTADDAEMQRQADARRAMLWAAARAVDCPTLVVHGALSDLFSAEDARNTVSSMAHARTVTIDGAGHTVQGDRPHALTTAVREFLAELDQP